MTSKSVPDFSARDLPIPVYLDRQTVFDLVAILEDGLADVRDVRISSLDSRESSGTGEAGIGANLSLLHVRLGGAKNRKTASTANQETSETRTFTPTALFARMRQTLHDKGLVSDITDTESLFKLQPQGFVEFTALLSDNPLSQALKIITEAMSLASLAEQPESTSPSRPSSSRKVRNQTAHALTTVDPDAPQGMILIEALRKALQEGPTTELIAAITGASGVRAVLSTKEELFTDTVSTVFEGEYRVLGKWQRALRDQSDGAINLLRGTRFEAIDPAFFESFSSSFANAGDAGIRMPTTIETEIKAPAVLIRPIAIFT